MWEKAVFFVKSLSEIKKSKPFYSFDLVVYVALVFLLVLLFLAVAFSTKNTDLQGFYIIYNNETAAEYYFDGNSLKVSDGYADYIAKTDDGIYFYPNGTASGEYNLIIVDDNSKTVKIAESTCAGHDCEKQKLSADGGFIYCAPHNLKITAMGFTDPVTG